MSRTLAQQLSDSEAHGKELEVQLAQNADALKHAEEALAKQGKELAEAKQSAETLAASLKAAGDQVVSLTDRLQTAEAAVKRLEADAKTAEERAAAILGQTGAKPVASISTSGDVKPTAKDLWTQYRAIQDPAEKNAFYKAHRDALTPKEHQSR